MYALLVKVRLTCYCQNCTHTSNQILKLCSLSICSALHDNIIKQFRYCHGSSLSHTIANLTIRLSLVPPSQTYRYHFLRKEMDTFYGSYISALRPYHIETENATAAIIPKEVARKIYGLSQEGVMNAFLQFHWITGGCKAYTTLIHLVSHNIP